MKMKKHDSPTHCIIINADYDLDGRVSRVSSVMDVFRDDDWVILILSVSVIPTKNAADACLYVGCDFCCDCDVSLLICHVVMNATSDASVLFHHLASVIACAFPFAHPPPYTACLCPCRVAPCSYYASDQAPPCQVLATPHPLQLALSSESPAFSPLPPRSLPLHPSAHAVLAC
jgi:hypothetical protein